MIRRILACIFFACILSWGAGAQILSSADPEADSVAFARVRARMDSIRKYRPTVGLVLAGGGSRGLAHLGVIKYMEELGIPVDVITGTSMGGLVGGLYALGYSQEQLDSLVRSINWPVMMSDHIPNTYVSYRLRKYRERYLISIPFHYDEQDLAHRLERERGLDKMADEYGHNSADMFQESIARMGLGMPDGFLYGLNVRNMLSSVSVGYQDSLSFADLPIPFSCVATDMYSMTPKYWTSGSLTDALRSTMAIPFYFRAVRKNGEILVDGGMRNNFPVDIAKAMGADIIIGSDMAIHRERDELNSPLDFVMQTVSLLPSSTMGPALKMLDLNIHHELKGYTMLSFDDKSVDDIIDQGYQNALDHKERFEILAAEVAGKETPPVVHHTPATNISLCKLRVSEIRFTGITEAEQQAILLPGDYPSDGLYDRAIIERLLNKIYGTNAFEAVTFRLEGNREPYTLVFDCQKGQVNEFAASVRADTDETVAVGLHLGLGTRRLAGPRTSVDMKLGTNPGLSVTSSLQSRIGLPTVGITARTRLLNTSYGYMSDTYDKLLNTALDVFVEDSRMRSGSMKLGFTAELDPFEHHLTIDQLWNGWNWDSYWLSTYANLKYDTFDDGYFPSRGIRLQLNGRYVFKGKDKSYLFEESEAIRPYLSVMAGFEGAFSIGDHFTVQPKVFAGWMSTEAGMMNPLHVVGVGGFVPSRYIERQIPYFAVPAGYRSCLECVSVAQVDFRYRFLRKNFVTVRGGMTNDESTWWEMFQFRYPMCSFGVEYARQSMVGPLKFAAQWDRYYGFSAYASVGFEF